MRDACLFSIKNVTQNSKFRKKETAIVQYNTALYSPTTYSLARVGRSP